MMGILVIDSSLDRNQEPSIFSRFSYNVALQLLNLPCFLRQQRRYREDVVPGGWDHMLLPGPSMQAVHHVPSRLNSRTLCIARDSPELGHSHSRIPIRKPQVAGLISFAQLRPTSATTIDVAQHELSIGIYAPQTCPTPEDDSSVPPFGLPLTQRIDTSQHPSGTLQTPVSDRPYQRLPPKP